MMKKYQGILIVMVACLVAFFIGFALGMGGMDPETMILWSDTFLKVLKDWWAAALLPLLALFVPKVREQLGKGLEAGGKKMQPIITKED